MNWTTVGWQLKCGTVEKRRIRSKMCFITFYFSFSQLGTCYVLLPGFPSPSPLALHASLSFFSSPSLCFSFRRWQTAPPVPFTVIIRSKTHWLVQKFKKKCRVCMCMQVRESRLSRKGELRVSMQFNARVWSRDCLLSATTSVCMLWRQIAQLLITDRFVIFLQRLV